MSIKINIKFFIFIILFFLYDKINIFLLMMSFGIVHECGHLSAGILLKLKPKRITLMPVGVMLEFDIAEVDFIKQKELIVSSAGPLVNLIIIICVCMCEKRNFTYEIVLYINLIMFLFNLLPIYPLDGGRILKSILHIFLGYKKSIVITNIISNVIACAITGLFIITAICIKHVAIGMVVVIIYLWSVIIVENKRCASRLRLSRILNLN